MPCDYSKYPANWREIRVAIMSRAQNRCECTGECGLHRTMPGPRRCSEVHHSWAVWAKGRIVLTVAHINHDTTDNRDVNLKAMCQRCHLRYDAALHAKNSASTRAHKRAEAERGQGQGVLGFSRGQAPRAASFRVQKSGGEHG